MFSISAMSPPLTPRGSIFSPKHNDASWTTHVLSIENPQKRQKLAPPDLSTIFGGFSKKNKKQTNNSASLFGFKRSTSASCSLAARRQQKKESSSATTTQTATIAPLQVPKLALDITTPPSSSSITSGEPSTGLTPIVKSLDISISTPIKNKKQPSTTTSSSMKFRFQKPAPPKSSAGLKLGSTLPKLNVSASTTGLISPPSSTPRNKMAGGLQRRRKPIPLSLTLANNSSIGGDELDLQPPPSPMIGNMPQTPMGANSFSCSSPAPPLALDNGNSDSQEEFLSKPTPPPVSWAPTFFVTPPSPTLETPDTTDETAAGSLATSSVALSPCTPPWPKPGASLRKTVFDHYGKNQLSPMDMRGYMAVYMHN